MISTSSEHALGELESLPLRTVWVHEAQNFTRWLKLNLSRLSDAIGIPLSPIDGAAAGGTQFADMLARDERDGSVVVIENQLEPANDAHLGQIMTYLAGVEARAVVWIAERFAEPHLSAIRWLNANAAIDAYAVRIRIVRIGDSALAPVFDVLARPNSWERTLRIATGEAAVRLEGFAGAFWATHLQRHPEEAELSRPVGERCRWRATKPAGVVIGQRVEDHSASVFLRGRHGVTLQAVSALLAPFGERLEQRLGVSLRDGRPALLAVKTLDVDVANPGNWPQVSDWLHDRAGEYDAALRDLVREQRRG